MGERGDIKGNGIPIQCSSLDVFSSLICQLPISVLKYCIQGPILPEQTHTRRRGDQVGALAKGALARRQQSARPKMDTNNSLWLWPGGWVAAAAAAAAAAG